MKRFNIFRKNVSPMPHTDEVLESKGIAYVDPLVYWHNINFVNKIDKRLVMYSDPLINAITLGWANTATTKTFKFYDSHEPTGVEIMEDHRAWWQQSNLDELLKAIIPGFCMDGWNLTDLFINKEGWPDYNVYGSYECDPIHWYRNDQNEILRYNVKYIPMPGPYATSGRSQIKMVDKEYKGDELLHFARGDWNYGLGRSRVMPVWDSATKLRHGSYADFFRRDVRFMVAVPENWKKKRIESFMQTFDQMLKGNRRAFIYKMEQSKDPSQTPLNLPSFGWESLAKTPAPKPFAQSEAGGQLLRDPEWARFLSGTRLTENYFIGNQAGAVTGSEVDLTRDFYTECEEFGLLEPVIKTIIDWFVQLGLIPEPEEDFVIKYWKDWEHIEKAAALAEQQQQMQQLGGNNQYGQQQGQESRREVRQQAKIPEDHAKRGMVFDCQDCGKLVSEKYGKLIAFGYCNDCARKRGKKFNEAFSPPALITPTGETIFGYRLNIDYPMTPVLSSTVKGKGVSGSEFLVQFHDSQGTYAYHTESPEEAEMAFHEMSEASPGGFIWDWARGQKYGPAYFSGRMVKGGTTASLVPYDIMGRSPVSRVPDYEEQAKSMRKKKMEIKEPPESREAFTLEELGYRPAAPPAAPPVVPAPGPRGEGEAFAERGTERFTREEPEESSFQEQLKKRKARMAESIFNSASAVMRKAKENGWSMSKHTAYKIMRLMKQIKLNVYRTNSLAYGNGIKADHALYYDNGDHISEEYICPESWKNNIGKTVPLGVYHNKEEESPELPDWQIIGTYHVVDWDEETGKDIAEIDYDIAKINAIFERLGEPNWITHYLDRGLLPDVSTAYTCDVVWDSKNNRNLQTNIDLISVSFVESGNCPSPECSFEEAA